MIDLIELETGHKKRIIEKLEDPRKAQILFFRVNGPKLQQRMDKLLPLEKVPRVFIHGNPHLDNYVRTFNGSGMVDFDRSRLGPYAWDIIRFFCSLDIYLNEGEGFVKKRVLDTFIDGYMQTFQDLDIFYTRPSFVREIIPTEEELTIKNYAEANIKWAKRMRKSPVDVKDERVVKMLHLFLESRNDLDLLKSYDLKEAGTSVGSLGKIHYLYFLEPKREGPDSILFDLKQTYTEEDDQYFINPVEHHGLRMIKASNLYAPGIEQKLGYFTFEGVQYWGREVPCFQSKINRALLEEEQLELSFCVGTQLGRGHRRSCRDVEPQELEKHLLDHRETLVQLAEFFNNEVKLGFEYIQKANELYKEQGIDLLQ
ncbi:MAG: DUF2252 family protein [Verrucomicrobiota bacterium]